MLALLSSMINDTSLSQEALLGALADAGGRVERAAKALNSRQEQSGSTSHNKRKRAHDLDGWITNEKRPGATSPRKLATVPESKPDGSLISGYTPLAPICIDSDSDAEQGAQGGGPLVSSANTDQSSVGRTKVPLMTVLKQAPTSTKSAPKLVPRTLGTPELVAKHTPCTLHLSILPPELACRLFYAMLKEAASWTRNKWWLFDRLVESPHRTSFYARNLAEESDDDMKEAARYWYNGRPSPMPNNFLPEMEEACEIIEKTVNEEILKRGKLFPAEWQTTPDHPWKANVAAANCYTGSKETVGYHSDQLTYLGPCPTIASLSLGTTRVFRLREVVPHSEKEERNAQTFNIPVTHNSLTIMHASCQERFKHTIPPQQTIDAFKPAFPPPTVGELENTASDIMPPDISRINITFRFYRPDFAAKTIPKCHCGIPTVLRPDMKRRESGMISEWEQTSRMRYFWMCYSGAQNEGKGCSFFQTLDMEREGRGCHATSVSLSGS